MVSCVSDGGKKNENKGCLTTLKLWIHAKKIDIETKTSQNSGIHLLSEGKSKITIVCVIEKSPDVGNSN